SGRPSGHGGAAGVAGGLPGRLLEEGGAGRQPGGWQRATEDPLHADAAENDAADPLEALTRRGWAIADPLKSCGTIDTYRAYIESSKGEWSVAKNGYVRGRSGWFSCRSACYLAAGRPVIVHATGFAATLPTGEGIVSFSTIDQAAEAIQDVEAHYKRHAAAARSIAEEYFDASRVLPRLIETALNGCP